MSVLVLNFDQLAFLSVFEKHCFQILFVTFEKELDRLVMSKLLLTAAEDIIFDLLIIGN